MTKKELLSVILTDVKNKWPKDAFGEVDNKFLNGYTSCLMDMLKIIKKHALKLKEVEVK